jgi:carboxypeptidase C (cathepsin A)
MRVWKIAGVVLAGSAVALGQAKPGAKSAPEQKVVVEGKPETVPATPPPDSTTENTVTVGGEKIAYKAIAGTITVGYSDGFDAMLGLDGKLLPDAGLNPPDAAKPEEAPATARMFYTAYFKKDAGPGRPVMFLYNGGPGSATMWLHMGSFGPRRVDVPDAEHKEGAPYALVENSHSLLDVTDLVFIDAPGTGFSRIMGKDAPKAFWGVDEDAHAFDRFIRRFLTKYDRWNSPKYLFGESYGTPRSAVLSADLQSQVDLNGIVLLSAILSFDNSIDGPKANPGVDQAYAIGLPTYAATAWYHHKLANPPATVEALVDEVERFAMGPYEAALLQGSALPEADRQAIAAKLHDYTGLPVAYILKSDLRIPGGAFTKNLLDMDEMTTGRLDTRYRAPSLDPLSEEAQNDPQSDAISSAYTAAINEYLRNELKYGKDWTYKPGAYGDGNFDWDMKHAAPGFGGSEGGTNVMPDLAYTMKSNPKMKVLLAGGYYDLATPFYEGIYEMHHLAIPQKLQSNIEYKYYPAGHMVYVNEQVLAKFHDDVAAFVKATEAGK